MLYKLIDNSSQTGLVNHNTVNAELDQNKLNFINNLDLTQLEDTEEEEEEEETNNNVSNADSDTDSGSGSDSDSDLSLKMKKKMMNLVKNRKLMNKN